MKCTICDETRILDENLADHFLEQHFEETARAFFDMYSSSMEGEVVNAMASDCEEDVLCPVCGDEEVENDGDICEDCKVYLCDECEETEVDKEGDVCEDCEEDD